MRWILIGMGVLIAARFFSTWFERSHLYFPSHTIEAIPGAYGLQQEEVSFRADDGAALHGWYIPAQKPVGVTILLCHGNAGNISHRLDKALRLHHIGADVFLFDYRGYGQSAGSPSERGIYRDAEAAYHWLINEKKIPASSIVLYGESLGSGPAIELATREKAGGLVLESAFTSVEDMGKMIFPMLPVHWMIHDRYDNLSKIGRVAMPVLILHSRTDEIVPFAMGQALFQAAPPDKKFVELLGGHNDGYEVAGLSYVDSLRAFFKQVSRAAEKEKTPASEND